MAINFSVGDYVVPNIAFIEQSLKYDTNTPTLKQSLTSLGYLTNSPSQVTATGNVGSPAVSYIRLLPVDTGNIGFNNGNGITVYFRTDTLLNNSFEISTSFIPTDVVIRCLNNTGSTIPKNSVVRQTGFDSTLQVAIIGLASASAEGTSVILGVTQEDIVTSTQGAVLVEGAYQTDTSSFALNGKAYLSNTNGAISTAAGTVTVIVGKVLSVGTEGAILLSSSASLVSSGGGGGSSGWTDNGGTVTTTTSTDGVGIGGTPDPNSKFEVQGDATRNSILLTLGTDGELIGSSDTGQFLYVNTTDTSIELPSAGSFGLGVGITPGADEKLNVNGEATRKHIYLTGGTGGAGQAGGNIVIGAGSAGSGNANGGNITLTAESAGGSGTPGNVTLIPGIGGFITTSGALQHNGFNDTNYGIFMYGTTSHPEVEIGAGDGTGNNQGGTTLLYGGNGAGTGLGGDIWIKGGREGLLMRRVVKHPLLVVKVVVQREMAAQ